MSRKSGVELWGKVVLKGKEEKEATEERVN